MRIGEADKAAFERDGYLQIPDVLTREQCSGIVDVIWSMMPDRFDRDDPSTWQGRIQDCCNNIPLYQRKGLVRFKAQDGFAPFPAIGEGVYGNAALIDIFKAFLGPDIAKVRVRGLNPNFPFPRIVSVNALLGNRLDEEISGGFWDRIKVPAPPQFPIAGHLETHVVELAAFIYLDDVGPRAGGLGVWPGSHRMFQLAFYSPTEFLPNKLHKRFYKLLSRYKPVVLEGKAGDVILLHNRLLHTNTYNRSNRVRQALVMDVMAAGYRDRAAVSPIPAGVVHAYLKHRRLDRSEPTKTVLAGMKRDHVAGFLGDHPGVSRLIQSVSQDPIAAGRNYLSNKVRQRQEGDVWVVVTQGDEHHTSYKLDAYGLGKNGRYDLKLDGVRRATSKCGIVVERLPVTEGRHEIRLSGWFRVPHYLRVVRTASPVTKSPVLLSQTIEPGARGFAAGFEVA